MTKKDIKKKLKNDKKAARIEYRALLTSAEECYRAKLGEAEQVYNKSMDEYYLVSGEKKPQNPPKRPLLEEIGNSITHGLGAVLCLCLLRLIGELSIFLQSFIFLDCSFSLCPAAFIMLSFTAVQ